MNKHDDCAPSAWWGQRSKVLKEIAAGAHPISSADAAEAFVRERTGRLGNLSPPRSAFKLDHLRDLTFIQAIAWIRWRRTDAVLEAWEDYRAVQQQWQAISGVKFGWRLEQVYAGEATLNELCRSEMRESGCDGFSRPNISGVINALDQLRAKLADGTITAVGIDVVTRRPVQIRAVEFRYLDLNPFENVLECKRTGQPRYEVPLLLAAEVFAAWREIEPCATAAGGANCKRWLIAQMCAAPDAPRRNAELLEEARRRFGVSERQFQTAKKAAMQETNAVKWACAGRHRKSPQ
jgi:hypothetical protein